MTQRSSTTAQILESDSAPSSRPVPVPGPLPRKKPKTGLNNKIRPQTAALPTQDEIDRDIIERMATDVPGWESGTDDGHEVYPQDDGNGRLPAVDSRLDGPVVRDPAREDPLQKAELLENSDLDNLTSDFRLAEYILTVDQAKVLLESFYVHLPFKRALHGVDPIQKLNILRRRLEDPSSPEFPTPLEFHHEMTRIFASVCDRHTMYLLPSPLREKVAFLGIKVEDTFDQAGQRRYLVTHAIPKVLETLKDLAEGDKDSFFEVLDPTGEDNEEEKKRKVVEVVSWNGVPIRRAVEINAENHAGSNLEARHARGLTRLTLRPLKVSLPPDERWATIGYRIFEKEGKEFILRDSEIKELTLPWRILDQLPEVVGDDPRQAATRGIDAEGDAVHQLSKLLFAKDGESGPNDRSPASQAFKSELGNEIGYLRIFTFNVDPCDFVKEFSRLLKQASQDAPKGLILDVRGNSGGSIWAAERILQFLTPRRIEPARFQVRNTPAIRELCRL
ncbi:MAG: hypothetical protein GY856_36495, partial [bacterium]|nr:hypothetical protein [bacterium]